MASSEVAKSLRIKTGACQRLTKEVKSYYTESEKDKQRLEERRAAGADEYDLKQLEGVYHESQHMISECTTRLSQAVIDLERVLADAGADLGAEGEAAKDAVKQATDFLSSLPATVVGVGS